MICLPFENSLPIQEEKYNSPSRKSLEQIEYKLNTFYISVTQLKLRFAKNVRKFA